jgi:hypothetical protein
MCEAVRKAGLRVSEVRYSPNGEIQLVTADAAAPAAPEGIQAAIERGAW